ncbi:uncharacterized protein LOC123501044 [Portunus trituberculatus]|uniref:BZIP domain-containing protein n=1 Tax=Portunus trituberculatus TaxID=210409 RepID=A0A5B7H0E6_PORTR|nr:uncharacterized protein LOC123501044 [Portunus trituberculatus]MPC64532.1 hypothetical protein [Portunus trituberculatus]
MAPMMIDQDPVADQMFEEIPFDDADINGINFDEIASLADMFPEFDNTKLTEDNNGLDLAPAAPHAVMVQPANPDHSALFNTFSNLQDLQPVSPEMYVLPSSDTFMQPARDASFLQPASHGALLQPASPGALLQPASPGKFLQPASPGTLLQPASPGTCLQPLSPAGYSIEPDYLQPQPVQYVQAVTVESAVPVLSCPTLKVTPAEEVAEGPKKRGRKPKYPKGTAPSRRSRPRKQKVYEMAPLSDEAQEKKRKNAINAKIHRDKQKELRTSLSLQLQEVTAERDGLLKLVEELKRSEASLRQLLAKGK